VCNHHASPLCENFLAPFGKINGPIIGLSCLDLIGRARQAWHADLVPVLTLLSASEALTVVGLRSRHGHQSVDSDVQNALGSGCRDQYALAVLQVVRGQEELVGVSDWQQNALLP
jgi:hypothetical protein